MHSACLFAASRRYVSGLSTSFIRKNCPRIQEPLDCRCGSRDPVPRQDERRGLSTAFVGAPGRPWERNSGPWIDPTLAGTSGRSGAVFMDDGYPSSLERWRNADEGPRTRRPFPRSFPVSGIQAFRRQDAGAGEECALPSSPVPRPSCRRQFQRRRRSGTGDGPTPRLSASSFRLAPMRRIA